MRRSHNSESGVDMSKWSVAKEIIESFALAGLNETMNQFNGK